MLAITTSLALASYYCVRTSALGGHCVTNQFHVAPFVVPWRTADIVHEPLETSRTDAQHVESALYCSLARIIDRANTFKTVCNKTLKILKTECYAFLHQNVVKGTLKQIPPKQITIDSHEDALFRAACGTF